MINGKTYRQSILVPLFRRLLAVGVPRQEKESGVTVSPEAEEKASMFDSYQASRLLVRVCLYF